MDFSVSSSYEHFDPFIMMNGNQNKCTAEKDFTSSQTIKTTGHLEYTAL